MSDFIKSLTAHIDNLETQHRAGINPSPDDIELLFTLNAGAKREHDELGELAVVIDREAKRIADSAIPGDAPTEKLARVLTAADRVEKVVADQRPRRRAQRRKRVA